MLNAIRQTLTGSFGGLKLSVVLLATSFLTGCFQIEGVHVLHDYGESDSGSYRISMNSVTYAALRNDASYSKMIDQLQKFSRPSTRFDGDTVHIEDNTGTASMEHFYDTYKCVNAPVAGYVDCRFAFVVPQNMRDMPDWSVDWEVVLQPDMQVLSSNHQRTRRLNGLDRLMWYYDGNSGGQPSVDFTIRVPRS